MSSTTAEPRFEGGPTLPEIAGVIAGIIALAIALAPSLSQRDRGDEGAGAAAERTVAPVDAAPPPEVGLAAHTAAPGAELPAASGEGAAMDRCSPSVLDDGRPAPGAFCPLPPRKQASDEARFVNLSFPWPPRPAADDR